MQKCSICDKAIYGHPQVKPGQKIVCGSCPLNKMQGGPSGKSFFEVRIGLAKMVTKQVPDKQESVMSDVKVKSNVKNRTILLDGRFPVVFDAEGFGMVPSHLMPHFEREMTMKPGRFAVVGNPPDEAAPEPVEVPMEVPAVVEVEPVKVVEVPATKEEVPTGVDLSFLTEEPVEQPVVKKASKKK